MNAVPPPVSIVIPARDETAHLPRALESILAQDYRGAIEVIVADGSETPEMADIVRARFSDVRIVPNPARHIPGGLNGALGAASHDFVLRCDARCDLPPDYVRKAVATLVRTGAAAAGGRQVPVGDSPFTRAVALAMILPLGAGDARYRIGGREGPADTVWPGAYRRGALLAAGGFDESLRRNEDYALHWKLRELGHTVWFDPDLHAGYRPRENFPALARQYFANGRWKFRMLRRHPRSLRARQLAPPALLLGLAASAALGAAGLGAGALVPCAYAAILLAAPVASARARRDPRAGVLLPAVLATMHLAWASRLARPLQEVGGARPPLTPSTGRIGRGGRLRRRWSTGRSARPGQVLRGSLESLLNAFAHRHRRGSDSPVKVKERLRARMHRNVEITARWLGRVVVEAAGSFVRGPAAGAVIEGGAVIETGATGSGMCCGRGAGTRFGGDRRPSRDGAARRCHRHGPDRGDRRGAGGNAVTVSVAGTRIAVATRARCSMPWRGCAARGASLRPTRARSSGRCRQDTPSSEPRPGQPRSCFAPPALAGGCRP